MYSLWQIGTLRLDCTIRHNTPLHFYHSFCSCNLKAEIFWTKELLLDLCIQCFRTSWKTSVFSAVRPTANTEYYGKLKWDHIKEMEENLFVHVRPVTQSAGDKRNSMKEKRQMNELMAPSSSKNLNNTLQNSLNAY